MTVRTPPGGGPAVTDRPVLDRRRAGVLLHPGSLPNGLLDGEAERFLDWLARAGFTVWQMLPIGPPGPGGSPYSSPSAFAGHAGLLPEGVASRPVESAALDDFRHRNRDWLEDDARFACLRAAHRGAPWWNWPAALRDRDPGALAAFDRRHQAALTAHCAAQYRFARHWAELRCRAAERDVRLVGDLPMFVVADGVDAWAGRERFRLGEDGRPRAVAGVPPDYFAPDGQCWDTPVYDWRAHRSEDFSWWRRRLELLLERFDLVRWDHFRGLDAIWTIPVGEYGAPTDPKAGRWEPSPGRDLLDAMRSELNGLPIIAENLGEITPAVEKLRRDYAVPGMHVLQFAFDGSRNNPHRPEAHETLGLVCTGTHDNDTTLGWWRGLDADTARRVRSRLNATEPAMPGGLIEVALASRSRLAVLPMQDLLGLGSEARMNRPGVAGGQWRWRLPAESLTDRSADRWRARLEASGRA